MGYHDILKQSVPAWYELDIRESENALLIPVHQVVANYIRDGLSSQTPIVKDMQDDGSLSLPVFIRPTQPLWGFGPLLSWGKPPKTNWQVINCKLPIIRASEECEPSWKEVFALSATLRALFIVMLVANQEVDSPHSQLLVINSISTSKHLHGGSLSVMLSKDIIGWISSQENDSQNEEVLATMRAVSNHMWRGEEEDEQYGLRVLFRQPKWVNLDCFGNSSGLDPENYYGGDKNVGYKLMSHNVDGPFQQLLLLSGIAKIHQLARKAGY